MPVNDAPGESSTRVFVGLEPRVSAYEAASVLVSHLFAQADRDIGGVSYAVGYKLSDGHAGGDIVDVYHFDNDAVALSIADISGKGVQAAVHAALIKYGLRAYSSLGLTPEKTMRAMDRLYLENSNFENIESFASVFLGVVDPKRRSMTYSSAGHEPAILVHPHSEPQVLEPTAPLIGVFDDQHHLFKQETVHLWPGSLLVLTTDGVTEARSADRDFYGIDGLLNCVRRERDAVPTAIVDAILNDIAGFSPDALRDDIAIVAVRFC
jgi:sigma-B regulation protein RsbU (phosphoserine phosphatase)